MAQDWPGNARALMSEAMRFAMGLAAETDAPEQSLSERMAAVERGFLCEALARAQGNATEAAQALGLPRKTLYDKLWDEHLVRSEPDGTALIYRDGKTIWVNRTANPQDLDKWDALLIRQHGAQLCRQDIVTTFDPSSGMYTGNVFLTEFVPYTRVD